MDNIIPQLEAFRIKCYRKMLLKDLDEDYSIQDYRSECQTSQEATNRLLSHLATPTLSLEERAELLLTIFVSLTISFRNSVLFYRATDIAFSLLPQLPPTSKLLCHLLVYLYIETEDEDLRTDVENLIADWKAEEQTEEDKYLLEFYAPMRHGTASSSWSA